MKIKILAVSTVLATVFFAFAAPVAKAVTVEELLAQIAALQAQIVALQAQFNQQTQSQQWCYTFNNYLIAGSTGKDVTMLQQALGKDGQTISDYSARNDGTFTEGTAAAVVKFQGKYGITQTGTVGPITRSKLNELYGCKSQPIACTMEAKLCPDGITYVGRTGPNCEFAACPTTDCIGAWYYDQNLKMCRGKEFCNVSPQSIYSLGYYKTSGDCAAAQNQTTRPSITITSPDSGQTFSQGATIGIAWVFSTPTQPMDVSIIDASGQSVGNFFQKVTPSNAYGQSIAFLTSSSSVDSTYIAPGQYKARVCISGTNDCAITDTYFTVVANTGPIVTLSVNGNKSVGYQNPTVNLGKVSQATITWSSVGADHCNTYGQTKLKLTDGTTWDKTNLPTSGYAIFNTPGQVDGLGNDMYTASIGVQCWNKDSSITDSKGIVVTWSTPPASCPVINCVWDPCPGGHSADENGCVNCSTVCRPRL